MKSRIGLYAFLAWVSVGCNITPPNAPPPSATQPLPEPSLPDEATKKTNLPDPTRSTGGPGTKIPLYDGSSPLPELLCGIGAHFAILSISPDPRFSLVSGTLLTIQARVQFSLPPNTYDSIGLVVSTADGWPRLYQTPVSEYTSISGGAAGGCDTVDLTLPLTMTGQPVIRVSIISHRYGNRTEALAYYYFDDAPYIRITSVAPAMNEFLFPEGLTGSVSIALKWETKGYDLHPNFYFWAYDDSNQPYFSDGGMNYPEVTSPTGAGTFTYDYFVNNDSCQLELWFFFALNDATNQTSAMTSAHWYIRPSPLSFALSRDYNGVVYLQPGAGPQTLFLQVKNCKPEDQTLQFTSDASWLTFPVTSVVVPGNAQVVVDYAADATGLVPFTEHQGTFTATSIETGDSKTSVFNLGVEDYYTPP